MKNLCALVACFLYIQLSALMADELPKVAVMDLNAKAGIEQTKAATLTDVLCTALKDLGGHKVVNRDDIQAMLSHVRDQQLLGCDDTRCLVQIGGALGVSLLVYGNIGMLGKTYVINLKLIDIDKAEVKNRISEKYDGNEAGLIKKMEESVKVLITGQRERPLYKSPWVRYGLITAGAASSLASYIMYRTGNQIYKEKYQPATTTADEEKYWEQVSGYDRKANILLGVSGAFLLGGIITFAF